MLYLVRFRFKLYRDDGCIAFGNLSHQLIHLLSAPGFPLWLTQCLPKSNFCFIFEHDSIIEHCSVLLHLAIWGPIYLCFSRWTLPINHKRSVSLWREVWTCIIKILIQLWGSYSSSIYSGTGNLFISFLLLLI